MNLVLLGTGAPEGWPRPRCSCSSCTVARSTATLRGPTAALLDGVLLVDGGPGTPHAAERAGHDLTGLRHVLLTHDAPGAHRDWLDGAEDLDVLAPRGAAATRSGGVRAVGPGERVRLGEHDVRVLSAGGTSLAYDVHGPSGRVLLAPHATGLPAQTIQAVRGAALDVLLLDETYGDHVGHSGDHLDLRTFPEQLRRLREAGAVTDATDVVAVRLSHRNPPTPELSRRLAAWGARVVADGAALGEAPASAEVGRTLVIGGARSGKSVAAEALLAAEPAVTYVATAYPVGHDDEWSQRVHLHQARRPGHWSTLETLDLTSLLRTDGPALLVDCLTLWLTRVMDRHGAWDDATWAAGAEQAVAAEVAGLVEAWRTTGRRVVAVTNEVGQGVVPDTAAGRRFRDQMGRVNAAVAAVTEEVLWCVAGRVTRL